MNRSESRASRSTVLVVDDDPDIADAIADVLRSRGRSVEIAVDGVDALAAAGRTSVGLVLLDWRLPGKLAGGQLVRQLRESCGFSVPVVVLSADPQSLGEARAAQVEDYLPKPFEVADLIALVDSYCPD
jgi:DNA-binding response OmpR family regulator